MKLSKLSRNPRLRNTGIWLILLLSIGFVIYNFGIPTIETLPTSESMSVLSSFWSDSIKLETNIPGDVLTLAENVSIDEKIILVDVSVCGYKIRSGKMK